MSEPEAGDKVVFVKDCVKATKGLSGIIIRRNSVSPDLYHVDLGGLLNVHQFHKCKFDVVRQTGKRAARKGIRITAREVEPDTLEIVDFTALKLADLPLRYKEDAPCAGVAFDGALVVTVEATRTKWIRRGDKLTKEEFNEITSACRKAGEKLRKINTYPKKAFEIVI
jgi:hypothetical protein